MGCGCFLITAQIILCVASIVCMVTTGTVYWSHLLIKVAVCTSQCSADFYYGLYRICIEFEDGRSDKCGDIEEPEGYLLAVRALQSIAITCTILAVILGFIHLYKVSQTTATKFMKYAVFGLAVIAAFCMVLGSIIYASNFDDDYDSRRDESDLHTSFYLNLIDAGVLLMVGGMFMMSQIPIQTHPMASTVVVYNTYATGPPAMVNTGYPPVQCQGQGQYPPPYPTEIYFEPQPQPVQPVQPMQPYVTVSSNQYPPSAPSYNDNPSK